MNKENVYIVSFSGGKDSTAMLHKIIENNLPITEIIFIDTGVEFNDMYNHINEVESKINLPITRIKSEKSYEYYMFDHIKTKGKNKGSKGYSWSDFRNRWCTSNLKQRVIKNYLKNKYPTDKYDIYEYHGIAYDELERTKKNNNKNCLYPLVDYKLTEKDCLEYCYQLGYTWNNLYNYFDRVSCWCCPLKNLKELKTLYIHFPEYWNKLKDMDNRTYRKFRADYSVEELEIKFNNEIMK